VAFEFRWRSATWHMEIELSSKVGCLDRRIYTWVTLANVNEGAITDRVVIATALAVCRAGCGRRGGGEYVGGSHGWGRG